MSFTYHVESFFFSISYYFNSPSFRSALPIQSKTVALDCIYRPVVLFHILHCVIMNDQTCPVLHLHISYNVILNLVALFSAFCLKDC
jgi:hypothetical protein